jgi:dephospho-CoA kinase
MEGDVVLDGLYSWDEYKILNEELDNITMIAVIADKNIRYNRLAIREIRPLTTEQAKERDIAEIENSAKGGPIAYADYFIFNNDSVEEYKERLLEILKQI